MGRDAKGCEENMTNGTDMEMEVIERLREVQIRSR